MNALWRKAAKNANAIHELAGEDDSETRLKSIREVLQTKKYHPEFCHFKEAHLGNFVILLRSLNTL